MEDLALVRDLAVVWLAALIVGSACVRLKLPVIAGYILAGLIVGPYGARLISETDQIKVLAELGVALLLFALGVELSIKKVFAAAGKITVSALCQIGFTVIAGWLLARVFNLVDNDTSGLIFGFVCALSSTAVVTKVLVDRAETETTHGRAIVPMLLIQDLTLIPVVALLPVLQSTGGNSLLALFIAFGKAALLIIGVIIGAMAVVPRLLAFISRTNSRELFLLTVISLCLVVALVSRELGVSLALGAFLSGIMVSERPYGHQVLADILPLRDLFATLFFVSIGMLLNPHFIVSHLTEVAAFVVVLIISKVLIAASSSWITTRNIWSATLVGLCMAQIGEFSFVMATLGHNIGILSDSLYNFFFAGAVVTLALSPAVISSVPKLLVLFPHFQLLKSTQEVQTEARVGLNDHLILCGFGRMGRSIGMSLHSQKIPLVVIEVNGQATEELGLHGIRHIYGDAFNHLVLTRANVEHAACLVITLPDPVVSLQIVSWARQQNPNMRIVVRANRPEDVDSFRAAGANAVVQPEYEASIEATKMALIAMHKPKAQIATAMRDLRHKGYAIFRPQIAQEAFVDFPHDDYFGLWFSFKGAELDSIETLAIRQKSGATILAIRRGKDVLPHPNPSTILEAGDELYVAGDESQLTKFEQRFPVARFCPVNEDMKEHTHSKQYT